MLEVDVGEIEVDSLHEHVGGDEHFLIGVGEYSAVVAYAVFRTLILFLQVFRETVNQSELSDLGYFHLFVG